MRKIVMDLPAFTVSQVVEDGGKAECHIQVLLTMPWDWYEMIASGADSAKVSLQEYVTECAKDGLVRGYR